MKRWWCACKHWITQASALNQRFRAAHQELSEACRHLPGEASEAANAKRAAEDFLARASCCADQGNLMQGWSLLQSAERAMVPALSDEAVAARWCTAQQEAMEKLTGWRCVAARELAGACASPHCKPATDHARSTPPSRERLQALLRLLNDAAQNTYLKQHVVRSQVRALMFLWMLFLVAFLGLKAFGCHNVDTGLSAVVLACIDSRYTHAVQIGVFASLLSMSFNFVQPSRSQKVPAVVAEWIVMGMRPFVGAASAVAVVLLFETKLFSADIQGIEGLLNLLTFLAGFSERWFKDSLQDFVSGFAKAT
jgi:hypothetical protein